jgi:hypothetical protein
VTWIPDGPPVPGRFGNPQETWVPVRWEDDPNEYAPDLANPRYAAALHVLNVGLADTPYDWFATPAKGKWVADGRRIAGMAPPRHVRPWGGL